MKATWLSASPANTWAAEHDEVADGAAGERDRRACEQGVADELVREHRVYAIAVAAVVRGRTLGSRRPAARPPRQTT